MAIRRFPWLRSSVMDHHIAVIANPIKFKDLDKARAELTAELQKFGITDYDWLPTTAEDVGTGQAKQAVANGADMVLSWGGDGTVRAVAAGMLNTGIPLGILPAGTGNLVAKNLGLPTKLHGALAVALGGGTTSIDVNMVDLGDGVEQVSILMCGMGLDAAMMESPERVKAILGAGAYAVAAVQNLFGDAKPITIRMDGDRPRITPARMVVVANFGTVQMHVKFVADADAQDGKLTVLVAKMRNVGEWLQTGTDTLLRRTPSGKHRLQVEGSAVTLQTTEPWPREIDGDLVDPGDYMYIKVLPGALDVRVR